MRAEGREGRAAGVVVLEDGQERGLVADVGYPLGMEVGEA